MKILAISYYYPPVVKGGAEVSFELLLRCFIKHNIELLLITGKEVNIKNVSFNTYQPNLFWFPSKLHFVFEFFLPRMIAKEIIQHVDVRNYDVVLANDLYSLLVSKELKKLLNNRYKPKFVFIVRDYLTICAYGNLLHRDKKMCNKCNVKNLFMHCHSHNSKPLLLKPFGMILPFLVNNVRKKALLQMDGLIFISESILNEFIKRTEIDIRRIITISNIIKEDIIVDIEKTTVDVNKDKNVILYVGRMEDFKGVNVLVDVIPLLKRLFPHIIFYFIGEGRDKKKYIKKLKKIGHIDNVYFVGKLPHQKVMQFYKKAGIVVVPSLWPEPLGRTLLEAMYYGCIVIASNHGSFVDIIEDGTNGFLFENNNPLSLYEKLKYIIFNFDNLGYIIENAKKTILNKFNAQLIVKEYLNFFNFILQ